MNILAIGPRVRSRATPPLAARDRSGIGAVVFLVMVLVFAPIIGLHVVCLAHPVGGAKPSATSLGGDGGGARGVPARPTHG